jgi:hypothetical protein
LICQTITFDSSIEDQAVLDGAIVINPAGRIHSELICSHLSSQMLVLREPWNEEDYAWEFLVFPYRYTISVITGLVDERWQVLISSVHLFGFLWRQRRAAAVAIVAEGIDSFLKSDARFSNVAREAENA